MSNLTSEPLPSIALAPEYTLRTGYPPPTTYNALRAVGGLTPVSSVQAELAVRDDGQGAWAGVYVVYSPGDSGGAGADEDGGAHDAHAGAGADANTSSKQKLDQVFRLNGNEGREEEYAVGMGRILGDGSWYFHFSDIVVHPLHQRRGLGDGITRHLIQHIRAHAPEGGKNAYVTLLAHPPGVKLYERYGFIDLRSRPRGEMGMGFRMKPLE